MTDPGYYIGNFREEALGGSHHGWIVGKFFDKEGDARETDAVEIKYWEFDVGKTDHPAKESGTLECTLILQGKIKGHIGGLRRSLALENTL